MVFRTTILIVFSVLLFSPDKPAEARELSCLECHTPHYSRINNCISCHRGDPRSTRLTVAHRQLIPGRYSYFTLPENQVTRRGQRHLQAGGCRRCHLIGCKGNRLAGNLDSVTRDATPAQLFEAVRQPALLMPDFHFTETQIIEIVNALLAAGRESDSDPGEIPRLIYFADDQGKKKGNVFNQNCGDCHRILNPVLGSIGRGEVAPNLSGLLTEFYPRFSRDKERWSEKILRKWLKNPRNIRPKVQMPPVRLKQEELNKLLIILKAEAVQRLKDKS
ncbi:MAG: selenite/tellurite reduction operon c-type cytochrome lipoprotein ExtS [Thermodesulfobacteriota bacterium]